MNGDRSPTSGGQAQSGSSDDVEQAMSEWADGSLVSFEQHVDRKDIVRFAVATGTTRAVHHDPVAARAAGFADVVAPPMYYIALRTSVFNLVPLTELHPEGTPLRDAPPVPFTQAMAGETVAHLSKPFVAGDDVRCTRRVEHYEQKAGRSGVLTFVRFEYRYADTAGDPFVVEHFTRIFR